MGGGNAKFNFVGGHNDRSLIPVEGLIQATADVLRREGADLALYSLAQGPQGYLGLRQFVADKLARWRGISAGSDDVLITSGSGQAIDLINQVLLEPGDTVILEEFTYGGYLTKLRRLGVKIVPAPLDDDGIRIDALAEILAGLKQREVTPKYLCTTATIQNPKLEDAMSASIQPQACRPAKNLRTAAQSPARPSSPTQMNFPRYLNRPAFAAAAAAPPTTSAASPYSATLSPALNSEYF